MFVRADVCGEYVFLEEAQDHPRWSSTMAKDKFERIIKAKVANGQRLTLSLAMTPVGCITCSNSPPSTP